MSTAPFIDITPTLRLLGTAHVATASVEAVREQIETYKPKVVGVELCQTRHDALVEGRRLDKEGLRRVIKEGKAPMVLIQAMLSAEQRRMGLLEGQEPFQATQVDLTMKAYLQDTPLLVLFHL